MNRFLILIFIIFSAESFSNDEVEGHCHALQEIINFKSLDIQSCNFVKNLTNSPDVRKFHKEKIYEKFSEKLATKIEQNFEEIALLDQFFVGNAQSLLMGSEDVKRNCRIDHAQRLESTPGCNGKKLELLKNQLKSDGGTLYQKLSSKFTKIRNLKALNLQEVKQCPLNGSNGAFKLDSQLDNKTALDFIEVMKSKIIPKEQYDSWFNQYPTFKLIAKTNNPEFILKFINKMKSFSGSPDKAKSYISDFFLDSDNQKELSKSLASQCENINKSIETFLCKELNDNQLASLDDDASFKMFGIGPNISNLKEMKMPENDEKTYMAFGFKCMASEDPKEKAALLVAPNTVDKWFSKFNENMRPESNDKTSNKKIDKFCKYYTCENTAVKNMDSCKKGGPLRSEDLYKTLDCKVESNCPEEIRRYISYLKTYEKENDTNNNKNISVAQNSTSSESTKKTSSHSSFVDNFLGVEGSLIAEGKSITPTNIAEKSSEFIERKLDPTPSTTESKKNIPAPQLASNTVKNITEQPAPQAESHAVSPKTDTAEVNSDEDAPKVSSKTKSKRSKPSDNTNESSSLAANSRDKDKDEIERMKGEINSLRDSMKNSAQPTTAETAARAPSSSPAIASKLDAFRPERQRYEQPDPNSIRQTNWQPTSDLADSKQTPSPTDASGKKSDSNATESSVKSGKKDSLLSQSSSDAKSQKDGTSKSNSVHSEAPTTELSSDELADLKLDTLKKLGINSKNTFIIKIRHLQKIYDVQVKSLSYQGRDILVPLINEKNSALSKIILDSPLFKEFKQLQLSSLKTSI